MQERETVAAGILEYAGRAGEGAPLAARELLHLGSRAAVDQALGRLAGRGDLLKIGRGIYVQPVQGKFGRRPPAPQKTIEAIARSRNETVARHGAAAANSLGLTTQVPVREIYLTSGKSRTLKFGAQAVEMRHASPSQLVLHDRHAGDAIRALRWLGPEHGAGAVETLKRTLPRSEIEEISACRAVLPEWMANAFQSSEPACPDPTS